jgi:hypothetical protein
MRIYEGSPRQDYEEVLRSMGAMLDQRGMREILLTETTEGYLLQGLVVGGGSDGWTDPAARVEKQSMELSEEEVGRFMDEGLARRSDTSGTGAYSNFYERALRVLGRYLDEQKPKDIFLFEQERAFVLRLLMSTRAGPSHVLAEFTREDIETMIANGPALREELQEGTPAG